MLRCANRLLHRPDRPLLRRRAGAARAGSLLIRDVGDPRTQRGVVIGSFIGSVAGLVVALTGQFWGLTNQFGWSTVAIYALLTLGHGSIMFGDRPLRDRTAGNTF